MKLKLAETHLKLGEVGLETGNGLWVYWLDSQTDTSSSSYTRSLNGWGYTTYQLFVYAM